MLVFFSNEIFERLWWISIKLLLKISIQSQIILSHVFEQIVSAQDFSDFNELIIIIVPKKEGVLLEDDFSHGAPRTPHVKGVVVLHVIHEQFRSLVVARGNTHIIGLVWHVEVGKTPIYDSKLLGVVVKHQILWLDIPVHNALGMTMVEGLNQLVHVIPDILIFKP